MKVEKSASVGSRSSRFLCFKPVEVEMDFYPPGNRRRNQNKSFIPEKGMKIDLREEKMSRGRGFARAVKAVLFQSKSMRRKLERDGVVSDSMRSDGSCSFRFTKRNHVVDDKTDQNRVLMKSSSIRSTSSSTSSSSSSSASSSSCLSSQPSELPTTTVTSSTNSNPKPSKQSNLTKQSSGSEQSFISSPSSILIGFMLVLLSLTLTIFCGKLWAIAVNAMWLYWIPQQGRMKMMVTSSQRVDDVLDRSESSREQRRRVIMEGLLDRSHHHHIHH